MAIPYLPHFDDLPISGNKSKPGQRYYQLGASGPPTPIPSQWEPGGGDFMTRYMDRIRQNNAQGDEFAKAMNYYHGLIKQVDTQSHSLQSQAGQPPSLPGMPGARGLFGFGKKPLGEMQGPTQPPGADTINWGQKGELGPGINTTGIGEQNYGIGMGEAVGPPEALADSSFAGMGGPAAIGALVAAHDIPAMLKSPNYPTFANNTITGLSIPGVTSASDFGKGKILTGMLDLFPGVPLARKMLNL
jgi:hypothetical protein